MKYWVSFLCLEGWHLEFLHASHYWLKPLIWINLNYLSHCLFRKHWFFFFCIPSCPSTNYLSCKDIFSLNLSLPPKITLTAEFLCYWCFLPSFFSYYVMWQYSLVNFIQAAFITLLPALMSTKKQPSNHFFILNLHIYKMPVGIGSHHQKDQHMQIAFIQCYITFFLVIHRLSKCLKLWHK